MSWVCFGSRTRKGCAEGARTVPGAFAGVEGSAVLIGDQAAELICCAGVSPKNGEFPGQKVFVRSTVRDLPGRASRERKPSGQRGIGQSFTQTRGGSEVPQRGETSCSQGRNVSWYVVESF